jgi:MoxR-like ATPase
MNNRDVLNSLCKNVEKVIIGKDDVVKKIVLALISGGHVLIEDVPGVGKTTVASSLAKSLNSSFSRIQFTADIMPSDITGFSIYNPKTGDFTFKKGAIMSNFVLADEINRTTPKTQASLLEAMEEGQVTVDGKAFKLPQPFMVLATQNPIEYIGPYPLPEAQLDRFFMKLSLGYPGKEEEKAILSRHGKGNPLAEIMPVAEGATIIAIRKEVEDVFVHALIEDYIISIIEKTRNHPRITLGCSPRASLALYKGAQANAYMSGRDFVIPDDVKSVAEDILSHRLILKHEYRSAKNAERAVIAEILKLVLVPAIDKK